MRRGGAASVRVSRGRGKGFGGKLLHPASAEPAEADEPCKPPFARRIAAQLLGIARRRTADARRRAAGVDVATPGMAMSGNGKARWRSDAPL
jgi:hypothetical protein